jgi:hypothetical protein
MNNVIRFKHIGLLILFTLTSNIGIAGGSGTGGGVEVRCTTDQNNGFSKDGFYLLDYVQASKEQRKSWTVSHGKDDRDSVDRIITHLKKVKRILQDIKNVFPGGNVEAINNFPEKIGDHQLWYSWEVKLKKSEQINGFIPKNCEQNSDQVVTYKNEKYWYWGQGLSNLEENSIEQYAALYTHEMLRMFGMDTEQVLKWTPVFHDSEFLKLTGNSIFEYLRIRGLIDQTQADIMKATKELLKLKSNQYSKKFSELDKVLSRLIKEVSQIAIGYNENTDIEQRPIVARALLSNQVPRIKVESYQNFIYMLAFYQLNMAAVYDAKIPYVDDAGSSKAHSGLLYLNLKSMEKTLYKCLNSSTNCNDELPSE